MSGRADRRPVGSAADEIIEAYRRLNSYTAVAKEKGVSDRTIRRHLRAAGIYEDARWKPTFEKIKSVELPQFPDDDIPLEDLIDLQCRRFETRKASHDAHTWFPVKIKENKPIGILFFGDPHLDDNGCNWPLLRKHAELCKKTDGLYGANIGDTTNNWAGKLIRLYAEQDASVKTARRYAQWLMLESGITWLIWLIGNHDAWGDGAEVLSRMARQHGTQQIVCHDWEARFRLVFPDKTECKVYAAHNHPGNSMWNPLHGQVRAAKFGAGVDLVIAGDKHNWGISQWEMPEQDSTPLMIRVRGYKHMDDYARHLGKVEQETGQAILTIFNPWAGRSGKVLAFCDVESGADYLSFLRRGRK